MRYPAGGLSPAGVLEIRRIKARVDAERLPRGADPNTHTKLGRGGLADVEWTVQLLQLRLAGRAARPAHAPARWRRWRPRCEAGRLSPDDAAALESGLALRQPGPRRRSCWCRTSPATSCPNPAGCCGRSGRCWDTGSDFQAGQLIDDYRRVARRARKVVESVFYDQADRTGPPPKLAEPD